MFSKLLNKILSNKRNILFVLVWISLFFVLSDSAFAVEQTSTFADTKKKVGEVIQYLSTIIAVFLALITYLTTMFLSPEWINGSLFWLNTVFKSVWVMVSNIVYLIFAFILIWIAFMNIIWKWTEKYALKQALPKFIIGILIVPFSWFLVNFILSISAILTISALNLPFDTFDSYNEKISTVQIPKTCTFNPDNLSATWATSSKENLKKILNCDNKVDLSSLLQSDKSWDSIFWVVALYTYWVLNLESFDNLDSSYLEKVKNIAQLILKIVFDFLFIVVYSVLMIALWLVLMTRWIYLWIYMMISPLFWLMYFFDKSEWWSGFFEKFNLKQFISLAFVPVFAMLALSFWMLFMYMIWNGMTTPPWPNDPPSTITIKDNTFKINEVELTIDGSITSDQSITDFMKWIWNGWLWVIWSLILKIFGVVVLWWAVMAALRTNEITKAVVEPLYQFGTKVWELATKSPQYAPIFGGQSMESLSNIWTKAQWYMSSKSSERSDKFIKDHWLFWSDNYTSSMQKNLISAKSATSPGDIKSVVEKSLKDMEWNEVRIEWKEFKELLAALSLNKNVPNEFKEFMNSDAIKWKTTLTKKEAADALWKLDSPSINLDINWNSVWTMTPDQLIWYVRGLKSGTKSEWENPTVWTTNQTVNLNIKNWSNSLPVTLNNVSLTDKQKTDISSIDISTINTKANMVKELNKIWITELSVIENIIKAIDPTWVKFTS